MIYKLLNGVLLILEELLFVHLTLEPNQIESLVLATICNYLHIVKYMEVKVEIL